MCVHVSLQLVRSGTKYSPLYLVYATIVRGFLIPFVSLLIVLTPMLPLRHATGTIDHGRFLWMPIVAWYVAWLIPVS